MAKLKAKPKVKLKTNKAVKSRFKITGTGKLMSYGSQGGRHKLTSKSSKRKRRISQGKVMPESQARLFRFMISGKASRKKLKKSNKCADNSCSAKKENSTGA